ncbi:MAG: 2'-5' RNA ligase family protein [Candidatus Fimivivens sp.]
MNQIKTLCVMGTFDEQTNQRIRQIKEKLKAQNISIDAYEPHITFGIYTHLDEISLFKWISKVVAQHKRFPLSFRHFGFFPDSQFCFLVPCANYNLLELHSNIHEQFDSCCTDKGCLYSLNQKSWSPHMTIASVEPEQVETLFSILSENFSPFTAELMQLKITASDASKPIGIFDLKNDVTPLINSF